MESPWLRKARVPLFTLAYFLLAWLSYELTYTPNGSFAAWWAPSGLALFALLRAERRTVPLYLAGIVVASAMMNLFHPLSLAANAVRVLADCVEPLAAAVGLRSLFGRRLRLVSLREVLAFAFFGGLVGPVAGTAVVVTGMSLLGEDLTTSISQYAALWWGSATLGAILLTPAMLTLGQRVITQREGSRQRRWLEASGLIAAVLAVTLIAFLVRTSSPLALLPGFAVFPPLVWAAVRFGPAGAARVAVGISLISLGPLLADEGTQGALEPIAMQGVYALAAVTALLLAAVARELHEERARAEANAIRAEESLALLESALHGAPFNMAFVDRELRLSRINDHAASLATAPRPALLAMPLSEAMPEVARKVEPQLRRALGEGHAQQREIATGNSGRPRYWLCSTFPVRSRTGEVQGAGLLMVDVTARREAENERNRLFRETQKAVRVRDDFLSIASHELKTPLTPLAARLRHIQRRLEAGETIPASAVDKPLNSLRKLTELINDLLDASRIENGRLMLHRQTLPLNELVQQVSEPFLTVSPRHSVELVLPDEPVWVSADPQRLAQVMTNLLDNAIKYSPSGGRVRVELQAHPEGAELIVSDEGIGIPDEQLTRLFERFYRATNAKVTSYGGLGLGLYITRDIVEHHGGRIWAESEPGRGARFHVVLPRLEAAEAQEALH